MENASPSTSARGQSKSPSRAVKGHSKTRPTYRHGAEIASADANTLHPTASRLSRDDQVYGDLYEYSSGMTGMARNASQESAASLSWSRAG